MKGSAFQSAQRAKVDSDPSCWGGQGRKPPSLARKPTATCAQGKTGGARASTAPTARHLRLARKANSLVRKRERLARKAVGVAGGPWRCEANRCGRIRPRSRLITSVPFWSQGRKPQPQGSPPLRASQKGLRAGLGCLARKRKSFARKAGWVAGGGWRLAGKPVRSDPAPLTLNYLRPLLSVPFCRTRRDRRRIPVGELVPAATSPADDTAVGDPPFARIPRETMRSHPLFPP